MSTVTPVTWLSTDSSDLIRWLTLSRPETKNSVPADGLDADFVGPYEPNNSGVGGFKKDLAPAYLEAGAGR